MLIGSVVITTILSCIAAADIPLAVPPPFKPRHVGFPRAQVGMFKPNPIINLGPRLQRRLPPLRNKIWLKKFDPHSGSWIKVLKERPNIISPKLHHHFAKKAHFSRKAKMNKMMRLRMNPVRGRLFPRKGRGRRYKHYSKKPIRMVKIRPGIRTAGFLRQRINGKTRRFPLNPLQISRRKIELDERFRNDNEYFDDLKVDDDRRFSGIQNSFDGRFSAGFRNNHQPNFGSVGAGVGGPQLRVPVNNIPQTINPSIRGNVDGFQQNDAYYQQQNNIPNYATETFNPGGMQGRMLNPANKIKPGINAAVHGSFDRKSEGPFEGVTDIRDTSFNGLHRDDASHLNSFGDAGMLGSQQPGFIMNSDDLTRTGTETPIFNDRILDTPIASGPVSDIGLKNPGIPDITDDSILPDGLLHDFHDVEDLDKIGDRDDHFTDKLVDDTDSLRGDDRFDLDDHIDKDVRSDDRLDLDDKHQNTFTNILHVQNGVRNDFMNMPYIPQASDKFERDDKDREHDSEHLGHDDSPIAGLQLLGSSRWSDIISELTNAGSHNHQIYDQVARQSIPVFPVNPHTPAAPFFPGEHKLMENDNEMGPGTLALLGIDPRNIAMTETHPPPFPIPETFETVREKNSVNSVGTSESVVVIKNDDSVTTVVTKQPLQNKKGTESKPPPTGSHRTEPTLDISKAAEQLAMFGALDNLDFGNDSFDEDLRL